LLSCASVAASILTQHWFATPFALLFAVGYGYVAALVAGEQLARRRDSLLPQALRSNGTEALRAGPAE
jgi:hypothetical protein